MSTNGDEMGDCDVCGAMKVGTRIAMRGRTSIEACTQCIEKMGLDIASSDTAPSPQTTKPSSHTKSSGNHRKGHQAKNIMHRRIEELRTDFATVIRQAREAKGWDQRELAKRMAERVNIIQHTEGGKRPTDSVVTKFERILGIKLMVERSAEEESHVHRTEDRPMTMADLYEQAQKELRGE